MKAEERGIRASMEEREATVLRGELELSDPNTCRICLGLGWYSCSHCEEGGTATELKQMCLFTGCQACDGEGKHRCQRCNGSGKTAPYETQYEGLRDVALDGYRLQTWQTHEMLGDGPQEKVAYRLTNPQGIVLFEVADYGCSTLDTIDGDKMLRSLIGWLTLRPGDTDEEYFYRYTSRQWEFANGPAEELSLWELEPEHLPECRSNIAHREDRWAGEEEWHCANGCPVVDYAIPNWDEEDEGEVVPPSSR